MSAATEIFHRIDAKNRGFVTRSQIGDALARVLGESFMKGCQRLKVTHVIFLCKCFHQRAFPVSDDVCLIREAVWYRSE